MNTLFKYLLFSILVLFYACSSSQFNEEKEAIVGDFRILVLSDVHISNDKIKDNRFKKVVELVNTGELFADMMVITGDCVSSIYDGDKPEDHKSVNNRLLKLNIMLERLEKQHYLVMGNHDYKIDKSKDSDDPFSQEEILAAEKIWKNVMGMNPYYSIEDYGWKFIFLNSMRGRYLGRNFDKEQMRWLSGELNTDKPVLIFLHHPVETDNPKFWCYPKDLITPEKEPEFFRLMRENNTKVKGIFVGHGHMWVSDVLFDKIRVFETDSFGDAEGLKCSIIGVDTVRQAITVGRYDDIGFVELERN